MAVDDYVSQNRGDLTAYDRYLAGMDASMRQKIALTAAHLPSEGRIADMGMGSGAGSFALAALYPRLEVVGVDIDPVMVELARSRHVLGNLSFRQGDIGAAVFDAGTLDGILDCSVLHHVTSFGGYEYERAAAAIRTQASALKPNGVLVVRDFVDPGVAPVFLELSASDGDDGSHDPQRQSSAALLERFAREFRSLSATPGFALERVADAAGLPSLPPGWRRYRLAHKHAVEFVLRKDYRADWQAELKEEYTYFTQAQFEQLFADVGLRVLASTPLWNAWIVNNRFAGKFLLRDARSRLLEWPATNYIIVGEKVSAGRGVRFKRIGSAEQGGFLRLRHYRRLASGRVYDLAARPHRTLDIVPFFVQAQQTYVLARASYPRPLVGSATGAPPSLDGATACDYLSEPLSVIQTDWPLGQSVDERLHSAAGIEPRRIRRHLPGTVYYPSPGGILEEVQSTLVEIDPAFVARPLENVSGFFDSGRLHAIEARQLLRAAQVGGLADARLEINTYDLLLRPDCNLGPWIGEPVALGACPVDLPVRAAQALLSAAPRRAFEPAAAPESSCFLALGCERYVEVDARAAELAARALEYVVPRTLSANTIVVAVLARRLGEVLIGVDDDDLPAAQCFSGNSNLLVAPAWRLPREVDGRSSAVAFARERLRTQYGIEVSQTWALGGRYLPTPGLTPEAVYPYAFELRSLAEAPRALSWVPLRELVSMRHEVHDGHLRVVSVRAAHALLGRA